MSLRALELGQFHLHSSADDLKLSILTIAHLRVQASKLLSLHDEALFKALTSGGVWVCRGKSCRFDIQITFNGNVLCGQFRNRALESLGSFVRDLRVSTRDSLVLT